MRTSRRGLIERGVGVAGAWWLGGVEAMAQEKAASPVTPENPANLSLCLPFLDWEPAERGTLLIVAPERATLPQPRPYYGGEPPPVAAAEPVRAGRNGFRLAAIAPRYRRKLAVVGGLSAVVPEMMAVLRYKNLPEPDLWQGVRPESRPQFLLASLSPAQWKRAMSPDGIGMSELKRDQQTLFAGLLSADIALRRQDPPAPGQTYGKTELVPTSDIDMATPRLRLYQELHWNFLFQDSKHGTLTIGDPYRAVAAPVYRFESAPRFPQFFDDDDLYGGGESPSAFGVMLVEAQPNRDKPSDVDYDAAVWNAAVPLEGTRTVGELVVRVRKATGIEIYADGRYTALSVYSRAVPGVAVRSGDLLKAIALSVTGTYRRVASGSAAALVLTDDRVGLGVRVAAIGDWLANARQQLIEARDKLIAGAKDADVSGTALWSLNDDGVPSPALLKRMAEINAKPVPSQENIAEQLVPISQLPPGVQERVRNQQQDWRAQMARSIAEEDRNDFYKPIREDGVVVRSRAKLAIVLPGIGSVALPNNDIDVEGRMTGYAVGGGESAWYASSLIPPDFKATLPVRLDTRRLEKRMLVVRVSSDADARDAALLAKARGFTGLLLPTGEQNAQTAGAWATAAKTAAPAIEIWLRTPLFRYAGIDTEPFLDRNIAGETYRASLAHLALAVDPYPGGSRPRPDTTPGDYVAIGDRDALQAVRARATAFAKASPQITGIVFTDTTPPGYSGSSNGGRADRELGYLPASRLAFLRETGTDPADLSPSGDLRQSGWVSGMESIGTQVRLPFFPDLGPQAANMTINGQTGAEMGARDAYPRWYEFRAKQAVAATNQMREAVISENPTIQLLQQDIGSWGGIQDWLPVTLPQKPAVAPRPKSVTKPVPVLVWLPSVFHDRAPASEKPMDRGERFARQLSTSLRWFNVPPTTPDAKAYQSNRFGLLLDLTAVPLADAGAVLSQIVIEPGKKAL